MRSQWSGTLVMIAQPGEETSQGAKAMLEDGLFTRFPHPTHAIAFHDSATPAGRHDRLFARARRSPMSISVDIDVRGVGGHGAYPHTTRDPIVLASRIVTTLQTLVSREIDPLDSAVVTVGSFHAGTKHNIISDEARLQLTVRSFTPGDPPAAARRHRRGSPAARRSPPACPTIGCRWSPSARPRRRRRRSTPTALTEQHRRLVPQPFRRGAGAG